MKESERTILEMEGAAGERYQRAWDTIVEPFFTRKQEELFEVFLNTPSNAPAELVDIRMQSNALVSLEAEFKYYIDTGKMARHTLDKEHEND